MTTRASDTRISGLASLIAEAAARGEAPVDKWDPPYCGDIGLAIRADGTWLYRGSPIARPALVRLFARVLRRDEDGRHYLVTPAEKVDVAVEDAPFLAVEMELRNEPSGPELLVRTNVDDIVTVDAAHPMRFVREDTTGGMKPYVLIRGRLEALLTRALAHELLSLAMELTPPAIVSGGKVFPLPAPTSGHG